MEILNPRCAGFDVHKKQVTVCLRRISGDKVLKTVRVYHTTTRDLSTLVGWLANEGVTHVAMESTGVYWKPIFNVLEDARRFTVLLCNAQHVKQVPGRKTDVKDCEWLAQLLQHGLLKGSFVPPPPVRELRDLTRLRTKLIDQRSATLNRVHKVLEDANVKLGSVATDVWGASGRSMIQSIIDGETDPTKLAEQAQGLLRGKIPDLVLALEGRVTDHHRFQLRLLKEQVEFADSQIAALDSRIQSVMDEQSRTTPPPLAEAGPLFAACTPTADESSSTLPSFNSALQLVTTIPGIKNRSAENLLAELGTNMNQWPSSKHLASWAGMCPGNNESAGKKRSGATNKGSRWLRRTLGQIAWGATHTKDTYFAAAYGRWAARRGKKKAIVALGHAMLGVVYAVLKRRVPYAELGHDHFERLDPQRQARYYVRRLEALGIKVTVETAA